MATAKRRSLAQIQAQIARLQNEAAAVRAAEVSGVIARVKEAIQHYGLTAADLGLAHGRGNATSKTASKTKTAGKKAKAKPGRKRGSGVVKYRNEMGNEWTGHGRRPKWYVEALARGVTEEQLRVK